MVINMSRQSLKFLISEKIRKAKKKNVFLRKDFDSFGGYDQVGRALNQLTKEGRLIKVGYGLYAKARKNNITGQPMIAADNGFIQVSEEALNRLKVDWKRAPISGGYNDTQVRTAAAVIISSRFNRKIKTDNFELRVINENK